MRCRTAAVLILLLCVASPAAAQQRGRKPEPEPEPSRLPAVAGIVGPAARQVEGEIVGLLRDRTATADVDAVALLDLRIDLRLLRRRLLALAADGEGDAQRAALLRSADLESLTDAADALSAVPSPDARAAMDELHGRTFDLADKSPDEMLAGAGALALRALGRPAASLPDMRPAVLPRESKPRPTGTGEATDERPLADRARTLSLSPDLRAALSATLDGDADEAVKRRAVVIAEGLAANTAADPDERRQLEQDLTDALTLLRDERLADLGRERLDGMAGYADLVRAAGELPAGDRTFDLLLAQARRVPASADDLLATARGFFEQSRRFEAEAPSPASARDAGDARFSRGIASLRGRFAEVQNEVGAAARQLAAGGASAESLAASVAELERINDVLIAAAGAPEAARSLERRVGVTPTDGLIRAAAVALVRADAPQRDPARDSADATLIGLSDLAAALDAHPAYVESTEAAGAAALGPRRAYVIQQTGAALAGARDLPADYAADVRAAMTPFDDLAAAVADQAALDAAVEATRSLGGWADWKLPAEALAAALTERGDALATAIDRAGSADAAATWRAFADARDRTGGVAAFALDSARYAPAVAALPSNPLLADAARLQTPSGDAPFAAQRYASVAVARWGAAGGTDPAMLAEINDALREEFGYR